MRHRAREPAGRRGLISASSGAPTGGARDGSASRPGPEAAPLTERSARVVAARKLTRRPGRERAGTFLAEGAQAVREALAEQAATGTVVRELFTTAEAADRHGDLLDLARRAGVRVHHVSARAAASLSETVTPQGLIAVCALPDTGLAEVLDPCPPLVAVLVDIADPGNAGTVVRVADAAGCAAVLFAGDTVDPYNGKAVRASTGSVFHLPVVRERNTAEVLRACRAAGLRVIGADGGGSRDLDEAESEGELARPTAWVFGSEAHGLAAAVDEVDTTLCVPVHGRAESLNLATATAVCLYASARAQRRAAGSAS